MPLTQQLITTPDRLPEINTHLARLLYRCADRQRIVKARRPKVVNGNRAHREDQLLLRYQLILLKPKITQPLGTTALHKFEVVGIVDHPPGVCILVVDPHRPIKFHHRLNQKLALCFPLIGQFWRHQAKMEIGATGGNPAARGAHHETLLNQVGL
jgi:hypothetical protein